MRRCEPGGSVCGVSATIAVGGAVGAKKEHMAIGISIVAVWAIVMIFVLPLVCKALHLPAGVAGAWIGTSEFADAIIEAWNPGMAGGTAVARQAAVLLVWGAVSFGAALRLFRWQ
jgi:uncharacterized membrane protein YadS